VFFVDFVFFFGGEDIGKKRAGALRRPLDFIACRHGRNLLCVNRFLARSSPPPAPGLDHALIGLLGAQEANQRVIEAWSRWWGRARKETIYAEQVSPVPAGNKI
jgi:hypothetical protein